MLCIVLFVVCCVRICCAVVGWHVDILRNNSSLLYFFMTYKLCSKQLVKWVRLPHGVAWGCLPHGVVCRMGLFAAWGC